MLVHLSLSVSGLAGPALPCSLASNKPANWVDVGPAGYGEKGGVASSGAGQAAAHLSGTTWLYATANGGVWKTENLLAQPEPSWRQVLDNQPVACTSISALAADGNLALAGCGSATSSEMGHRWDIANSGDWAGVLLSLDGGESWAHTSFPRNYYVSGVAILSATTFAVSAVSNVYDRYDGGVWLSTDGGKSFNRTLAKPVFDLKLVGGATLLATVAWAEPSEAVYQSAGGVAWQPAASGISFDSRKPFYPNVAIGKNVVFFGALTVNPANYSDTHSVLYARPLDESRSLSAAHSWSAVANAPKLDEDAMQKDRMALLVHPHDDDELFVAGNAGALTWRVRWREGKWTKSFGWDTSDGSEPHGDCRNYYWEPVGGNLVLLSDGGAFLRSKPTAKGGRWTSLAGDIGAMEFIAAAYEPKTASWVGGAQDNSVQLAGPNATAKTRALPIVGGDGCGTYVDTSASPARFYGTSQFYGNFDDDDGPRRRSQKRRLRKRGEDDTDDDDDKGGGGGGGGGDNGDTDDDDDKEISFGFATMDGAGKVELTGVTAVQTRLFFDVSQFPFFDQPFALNAANATHAAHGGGLPLVLWARGSSTRGAPSAFYTIDSPTLDVASGGDVYVFVAGGVTGGAADASVLVGMNDTVLFHRSAASRGALTTHPLPATYAKPVELSFWGPNSYTLGPLSHKRTVSLAVDPADSATVAVSGWTSIDTNDTPEQIYLTTDAGASWVDVTANLAEATGVCAGRDRCGKWRPSALLFVPLGKAGVSLLVGTVAGVFVAKVDTANGGRVGAAGWVRVGSCAQLPLVLVGGLSYEATSDTVTAATMGRGVYILPKASRELLAALQA